MTKHEHAAATWARIKGELIDRGAFNENFATRPGKEVSTADEGELLDAMVIAEIENSYTAAAIAVAEENEDRLKTTDNTTLTITKESDGRIKVSSRSFDDRGGHVYFRLGELMVVRPVSQGARISKRQG